MIDAIAWLVTFCILALFYWLFYKVFLKEEIKKQRELRDIQFKFYESMVLLYGSKENEAKED